MSQPQRTSSTESSDAIRKRVCKACDRCRLKKSKCDGSTPCLRCKADNAICVFGERKKSHDKVYPKGYVEMLEQQQVQIVAAVQAMYHQLRNQHVWNGPELSETNGQPLTHDILSALHLLEPRHDGSGEMEDFEENFENLQSRLIANGAGMQRRGSFSSESEHSQHGQPKIPASSMTPPKAPIFKENFNLSASPSPLAQSPIPLHRLSYPTPQHSPLAQSFPAPNIEPQNYRHDWTTISDPSTLLRTKYASQVPRLQEDFDDVENMIPMNQWADSPGSYDLGGLPTNSYQMFTPGFNDMDMMQDYCGGMELMDADYQTFLKVAN